ncbi:GCG_CRPN prefix-to-repeats domain-containing protein [Mesorhizobium koreense]|uniref:GCG_CRPN prefix-to-repeats domain-containing protein n=1 Tax=Mesorhizobium koreense TaxID=3074855 RepID=UPI00353055B3
MGPSSAATPYTPVVPGASSSLVINVSEGCGRGWHRNRWGDCVRNREVYRACPRGWHLNRRGFCVRNRGVYRACPPHYHLNRQGFCVPTWR